MGHGPLKNMRDFKAVAVDYEYYLTLSDDPVSVCLTERQMYVLSVQNTYTAWLTRWYNTDDINQNVVVAIAAEIEALLMCGCGIPQPTITDRLNTITYNNSTTTIYENTENTWNAGGQTVISIAPNLDWDTGDPIDIAKLTCAAIRNLLNAIAAQGKQMNQQTADQNKDQVNLVSSALAGLSTAGSAALVVGGGAAAVVGFFGGPWVVLGLALGAVGAKVATLFMGAPATLFDDTEALEKVACAMINNTGDGSMTREKFQAALTPNDFAPGSPEAQLAAMIQPYLDDLTVYLQFMSLGNQLYEVSDFALLPDCGCEPDEICYDFTTGQHGFSGDAYIPGEGYSRRVANPARLLIGADLGTRLVQKVTVKFNMAAEGFTDIRSYPSGDPTYRRVSTTTEDRIAEFDPPLLMNATNIDTGSFFGNLPEALRLIGVCFVFAD